jgi:hypothetical protein
MDVATHVHVLCLQSEYLYKLADILRIHLVMIEQALAEQSQPTSAQATLCMEGLLERSQQLVREREYLQARIQELAAKSRTRSDN